MKGARKALPLVAVSAAAKPVGFLKEVLVAACFGSGVGRDAFLIAWQIPNVMGSFVMEGLPQVLVPYLAELRQKEGNEKTVGGLLVGAAAVFAFLGAVTFLAAGPLVRLVAPFIGAETQRLAVSLLRTMAPSVALMGAAAVFTGLLYARRSLVVPALGIPLMNVVIILAVAAGHAKVGIHSLAQGVLWGSAAMAGVLLWPLRRSLAAGGAALVGGEHKGFLAMGASFFLGTLVFNAGALLEKVFASTLPSGSLSNLDYAFRLMQTVFTVMAVVPIFFYPRLCERAADPAGEEGFRALFDKGLRICVFAALPAAAFLWALRLPIVEVLFKRGAFQDEAARATAAALGVYAIGLVPHCVNNFLLHAFYARKDMGVRVTYGLAFLAASVAANLALIKTAGLYAIPIANTVGTTAGTVFLAATLRRRWRMPFSGCLPVLGKTAVLSVALAALLTALWGALPGGNLPRLAASTAAAAGAFFLMARLLKIEEQTHVLELVGLSRWAR